VGKGDIVLTLLCNDNFTMAVTLGVSILGAVASLGDSVLNNVKGELYTSQYTTNHFLQGIAHKLSVTKAKMIICLPKTRQLAFDAIRLASSEATILCWGEGSGNLPELLKNVNEKNYLQPVEVNAEQDMGLMFWSSGTTGEDN